MSTHFPPNSVNPPYLSIQQYPDGAQGLIGDDCRGSKSWVLTPTHSLIKAQRIGYNSTQTLTGGAVGTHPLKPLKLLLAALFYQVSTSATEY